MMLALGWYFGLLLGRRLRCDFAVAPVYIMGLWWL